MNVRRESKLRVRLQGVAPYDKFLGGVMMLKFSAESFYDKIADKYSWSFSSRDEVMALQMSEIMPILEQFEIKTILDCSCGDGLQAIPLARHGYQVEGGDISLNMVKKAIKYAGEENLAINFRQADFKELEKTFENKYDCILSWGNAFTHLLTDTEINKALYSIYNRLNLNGVAVIEMRNYDYMLETKNRFYPMKINNVQDGYRYSVLLVFDYLPKLIRFNAIFLLENVETGEKRMEQEFIDCNPIKKSNFLAQLKGAGFAKIEIIGKETSIRYIAQK
jgi:SAM-dependent methyltransferase